MTNRKKLKLNISISLAKANVLKGLSATTHHSADIKLEKLCQQASALDTEGNH